MGKFNEFIFRLGFDVARDTTSEEFVYSINPDITNSESATFITVDYFYFQDKQHFFKKHLAIWNRNDKPSFIAVFDNSTYIVDSRLKPDEKDPLSNRFLIHSFNYGVNTSTLDFWDELSMISKVGIDSSFYFDFVVEHQKRKKASEVDKDLLLNLLALKKDLIVDGNEHVIHLLLLRCLFIKYLEDRGVFEFDFLHTTLSTLSPEKLISAFSKVRKINGDLFRKNELLQEDIKVDYLIKLSNFFGYYDYRARQGKIFPYQFDKIPIRLISNIYESFLKDETKKGNGVYYTPPFLVNFVLSQTLTLKILEKRNATLLDPACGSGGFLVEGFRMLIKANSSEKDFENKKEILQNQLFGIDLDERALQIAAFSLYLALLEGEDPVFIQEKIRTESPILPSLLEKTLVKGNALVDDIPFELNGTKQKLKFDCIVANPPWGSLPEGEDSDNIKIRDAIGNKSKAGSMSVYKSVSDFQRSQAFLLRTGEWCHETTKASMIVNNSIFLNENASEFRKDFLKTFKVETFYELSKVNSILFKKHSLGEIEGQPVEIGANEPCCVLLFNCDRNFDRPVKYISPKLNKYTKNLRLISYGTRDIVEVRQSDLIEEDLLWRVFVNGGWADYQIIKKRIIESDSLISIKCRSGFQPKANMEEIDIPEYRDLITPSDFIRYRIIKKELQKFNWSQKLRRKPKDDVFTGERIIVPVRPLPSDCFRFRALKLSQPYVHTDNILSIKILSGGEQIANYETFLAILNSKFLGYYFYNVSSQWGKGEAKRSTLRNSDIESLPLPHFDLVTDAKAMQLSTLVSKLESAKVDDANVDEIEKSIDEIVYDLYNLSEYERKVVDEFFDINLSRKNARVAKEDLEKYALCFKSVFELMLSDEFSLFYTYTISINIGACICFSIREKEFEKTEEGNSLNIINLVKQAQTGHSFFASVLAEEKVKYYDKKENNFYLIKSNQFKDWTERQAIDDANEEIGDMLNFIGNQ